MLKQHNIALSAKNSTLHCTTGHVTAKFTTPFTWHTCRRIFNALPLGITPCKTVTEAKYYSAAILAVTGAICFLPLIFIAALILSTLKK